jgi:hypothetical protein
MALLLVGPAEVRPETKFVDIIPEEDRRSRWQQLQEYGFKVPGLILCGRGWLLVLLQLLFLLVLWELLGNGLLFFFIEIITIIRIVTRPYAIVPPPGYETIERAAVNLTRFNMEQYRAGLWTHDDIAAKVRLIVAEVSGMPFDEITDETNLIELLCC